MTPPPERPPWELESKEKMRLRSAAFQATRLYPGPVGELVSRELLIWEEFGQKFGSRSFVMRLVEHVMQRHAEEKEKASA